MSGHRNRLDIRVGIEIDLISVMGSNSLGFHVGNRTRLGFSVDIGIDLFLWGSKMTWF